MNIEFHLSVAISAGIGAGVVELLIKLFLSHWLERVMYNFQLERADRRECSDLILDLIHPDNYKKWFNISDEIYNKAYALSDRLITVGEDKTSKILDDYTTSRRNAQSILANIFTTISDKKANEEFLNNQHEIEELQKKLVHAAKKLRSK